jgi:hypothetical protein
MKALNLAGQRFGRLVVTEKVCTVVGGSKWRCKCDCGNEAVVWAGNLKRGRTRSCGCYHAERLHIDSRTHGMTRTRIYRIWSGMLNRCYNPNNQAYSLYGARGIGVCERWHTFENFLADMGENYRSDLTIDRIDNDGSYEPENCRWADWKTQARNKSNNRLVVIDGEMASVAEHAERYGTNWRIIQTREQAGWSIEAAITTSKEET